MTTLNFAVTIADDVATYVDTTTDQSEKVVMDEIKLAAGAADVSLTLSTLTHPTLIYVRGASGVSFKVIAGTDVIPANPCALIADADGFANASILLSNSSGVEVDVGVVAIE